MVAGPVLHVPQCSGMLHMHTCRRGMRLHRMILLCKHDLTETTLRGKCESREAPYLNMMVIRSRHLTRPVIERGGTPIAGSGVIA